MKRSAKATHQKACTREGNALDMVRPSEAKEKARGDGE